MVCKTLIFYWVRPNKTICLIARFKIRRDYSIRIHARENSFLHQVIGSTTLGRGLILYVYIYICIYTYYILILILRILRIRTHTHTFPSFLFTFHLSYHTVVLIPLAFNWWNWTALLRILGLYAALRVAACLWLRRMEWFCDILDV